MDCPPKQMAVTLRGGHCGDVAISGVSTALVQNKITPFLSCKQHVF